MRLQLLHEAKTIENFGADVVLKKTAVMGGKDGTPQGGNPYHQMSLKPAFNIEIESEQNITTDPPYDTHI